MGCTSQEEVVKAPAPRIVQAPVTIPTPTPTNEVVQSNEPPPPPAWGQQKTGTTFQPRRVLDVETALYEEHLMDMIEGTQRFARLKPSSSKNEVTAAFDELYLAIDDHQNFKNVPRRYRKSNQYLTKALNKMYQCAKSMVSYQEGVGPMPTNVGDQMRESATLFRFAANEMDRADGKLPNSVN